MVLKKCDANIDRDAEFDVLEDMKSGLLSVFNSAREWRKDKTAMTGDVPEASRLMADSAAAYAKILDVQLKLKS